MAIAFVRTQNSAGFSTTASTITTTLTAQLNSGNTIVVYAGSTNTTLSSMGAVTGITWTVGATAINGQATAAIGIAVGVASQNIASSTSITANLSASTARRGIVIDEFSGVDLLTPLQTSNTDSGSAGFDAGPPLTTTGTGITLVSANFMNNTIANMNPPTSPGTFAETTDFDVGTNKHLTSAYLLGQSAGTYTPTFTVGTGTRSGAEAVAGALNPTGTTPPAATHLLTTLGVGA